MEISQRILPGVSKWKLRLLRSAPSYDQLDARGQIMLRQFHRLLWMVLLPYLVGGGLLFDFLKKHLQ